MDLCTVVLERDVALDARKYGDLLAPLLGVTKLEAKIRVRKARGILIEDLAEEEARRLVERLAADGVAARCVRNDELPPLAAPRKVTQLERSETALRYRWAGEPDSVDLPWAEIDVVSIGAVALPEFKELFSNIAFEAVPALHKLEEDPGVRELLRENLILKMASPAAPAEQKKSPASDKTIFEEAGTQYAGKLKIYVDIVDSSRTRWLRIPMDEMAYAHEAGQVKFGEAWGLHLLVEELRSRCARAFTEVSARFVPGADLRRLAFLQTEEFNRYTLWHAVLHHMGMKPWSNADTSSPSPEPPGSSTGGGSSSASPPPEPPSTSA